MKTNYKKNIKKKAVLIFSGSNDRAVISFCRFSTDNDIPFFIIARDENDKIFGSVYKQNVVFIRKKDNISGEDILKYIKISKKKTGNKFDFLILPSTEYINRILLDNIDEIKRLNCSIGLCEKDIYEKVSDKFVFGKICRDFGIFTPKEFDGPPRTYPFVIKPRKYKDSKGLVDKPAIINISKDLNKYWKNKNKKDYYFQEFIGGKNFYLLYYFCRDGNYKVFSQENLLQQSNGGSMILARSSDIHKNKISKKFADLFMGLGFFGLVMVEVKYFKGKFYMIEANPRLWGPSQLILDSGMILFDLFALDNGLVSAVKKNKYNNNVWYFWQGGLTYEQRNKNDITKYSQNSIDFLDNYSDIILNEVYFRKDTLNIFLNENRNK